MYNIYIYIRGVEACCSSHPILTPLYMHQWIVKETLSNITKDTLELILPVARAIDHKDAPT